MPVMLRLTLLSCFANPLVLYNYTQNERAFSISSSESWISDRVENKHISEVGAASRRLYKHVLPMRAPISKRLGPVVRRVDNVI